MESVLITGAAGFIGHALSQLLLEQGYRVYGIDNLNDYYEVSLKKARLARLNQPGFQFQALDLADRAGMETLFKTHHFDCVINLAAQAGVRYSLLNPYSYLDSNLLGFGHILEACRQHKIKHLIFASSSSVYGMQPKLPFSERDNVDHPVSLYAATKKANELMAHSYAHLYGLPCTGLRFFTVYGPWGRPDMAYFSFTRKILADRPIPVFNHGKMQRDFTYIDDIVQAVAKLIDHIPEPDNSDPNDPSRSHAPYRIYNIGNHQPVSLMDFIHHLENALGKKAVIEFLPMQNGDVPATYADTQSLRSAVGFQPSTPLAKGLESFVNWYRDYYSVPSDTSDS